MLATEAQRHRKGETEGWRERAWDELQSPSISLSLYLSISLSLYLSISLSLCLCGSVSLWLISTAIRNPLGDFQNSGDDFIDGHLG
jgi:hypothetical protein